MRQHVMLLEKDEASVYSPVKIEISGRLLAGSVLVSQLHLYFLHNAATPAIITPETIPDFELGKKYGGILDDIAVLYNAENTPRLILTDNGIPVVTEIFAACDIGGKQAKSSFIQAAAFWLEKEGRKTPRIARSERPELLKATRLTA